MRIESAIDREGYLEVIIDGKRFRAGEKYTILELGYAVYLMEMDDEAWLKKNGDFIPADLTQGRTELRSGNGSLLTAHPVLVALAIESWWSQNGSPRPLHVPVIIPTIDDAVEIVRNRKILNDFNKMAEGVVPGLMMMEKWMCTSSNENLFEEIHVRKNDFMNNLNHRYWEYQQSHFPNWDDFFERGHAQDGRPPVFLVRESWRNVLYKPNSSVVEREKLFSLIPEGDHHRWFRSMNSSQALALSILGNLVTHDCMNHLSDLRDDEGDKLFDEAQISYDNFVMEHKIDYLKEPRRTSLDGFIFGSYRIAIECKYTESEVGTCSRPRLTPSASNYESNYCNGTYTKQRTRNERCSLTETGILYWKYLPLLFNWPNDNDLEPCPLNKNYQLVRNILAAGVNEDGTASIKNGHAVFFYDERNPAFDNNGICLAAYHETRSALKRPEMLRKCSWQRITEFMRNKNILPWLLEQLYLKYGL